jgi:hypothetical protein
LQIDLDDAQRFATDNEATVRAFREQVAPELGLSAQFIAEAVERAGGNLQHAAMLRNHLADVALRSPSSSTPQDREHHRTRDPRAADQERQATTSKTITTM